MVRLEGFLQLQSTKKPQAVPARCDLEGFVLTIEATGRRTKMVDLRRLSALRPADPSAPLGAVELELQHAYTSRSSRWYRLSAADGEPSALKEWLRLLSSAAPDRIVAPALRKKFRNDALVLQVLHPAGHMAATLVP